MENQVLWHAGKITEEQYKECINILENDLEVKLH